MRLILALIYIAVGMCAYFYLGGGNLHPFFGFVVWFALMFSSVIIFNKDFFRRLKGQSDEEYIQELLSKNLAVEESYKVSEALTFEDLSTSCLCHILKIGEKKAICLYGQYLYDYSKIDDDPELIQDRMFPTSEFSLIRKLKNDEIFKLDIGKIVIDEYRFQKVDLNHLHELGIKLNDGEIIESIDFSKIKQAFV